MPYMRKDPYGEWRGPYPNKVGEFCGNEHPDESSFRGHDKGFRIGLPSSCEAGTSEEMELWGFAGIYMDADKTLAPGDIAVDTDMLRESVVTGDREPEVPFDKEEWAKAQS